MKICKKCKKEFEQQKGLVNYCSLQCRNSRDWTEEDNKKKSESAKKSDKIKLAVEKRKINPDGYMIKPSNEIYKVIAKKRKINRKEKLMNDNYCNLKYERLRDRIFYEQNGSCNKCDNDQWLDKPIPLELEHKDGNHKNNSRENLEGLCPNCHAQTETWRGRNKHNNRNKISDEELFDSLLENDWNMRQSLLRVGLAAKGGNYNRCHRLKREYKEIVSQEGTNPSYPC